MSKLYYDVTQLVHWQGEPTGIPRVMKELAVRFKKGEPGVKFVSWVKEPQAFCEVDLEASLGDGVVYVSDRRMHSKTGTLQPISKRVAKKAVKLGAKLLPQASVRFENHLKGAYAQSLNKVDFINGDILFVPWGEWWDDNFIIKLKDWHNQSGLKLVQLIHDMGPMVIPQLSGAGGAGGSTVTFPNYCRQILPISETVLAVSQNTKKDIIAWLKQNKLKVPRIEVFREGDDVKAGASVRPTDPTAKNIHNKNFILTVGTVEARKNHFLLYYVYKLALARGLKLPKLVIAGRPGWGTEDIMRIMKNDPDVRGEILFLHGMSDAEISWLYDNCLFTIMPSFYEGWGIPVAESLSRGVPCLCSNTSSMVEIADGIVGYFSPVSSDECLAAITKWLKPDELKKVLEITKKYQPTTWDDSYHQVHDYIMEIQ